MLKGHMISMIRENLGHQPTSGQEELIGKLADFIMEDNENTTNVSSTRLLLLNSSPSDAPLALKSI